MAVLLLVIFIYYLFIPVLGVKPQNYIKNKTNAKTNPGGALPEDSLFSPEVPLSAQFIGTSSATVTSVSTFVVFS